MCGIAGQVAVEEPVDVQSIERMSAAQVHRGPDSSGVHVEDSVGLAIRRLAVIDVKTGDQPLYNEDRSLVVVSNGEIYNFRELRSRLEAAGHRFETGADTEVLVHLYEERGPALVEELRGMYAFALWDSRRKRLLLARDRVGKKPLFYFEHPDGSLSFASELAALLEDVRIPRRLNPSAVDAYLTLLYVPNPLCAVDGVRKLPPASTLIWEGGKANVEPYWSLDFSAKEAGGEDEIRERIWHHLCEAVELRLISDRPLGAFLSGGVDSAAVVAAMAERSSGAVKTFSIGFDSERFNELAFARQVADRYATDHTEYVVQPDALSILPKLITHYGEPFGDSSAIPSYYVSELARQEVVVALNGDGGDESFGGYNRYVSNTLAERLMLFPRPARQAVAALARAAPDGPEPNSSLTRVRRLAMSLPLSPERRYLMRMTYVSEDLREELYEPSFKSAIGPSVALETIREAWNASTARNPVDRMLDVDVKTYLPGDLLTKMDIATMANSLEARSPFLDHVLMEMAARLPVSAKVKGITTKVGLKMAMRGRIPDELIDRPKWGFSVPLAEWLRGPLRELMTDILLDARTLERGFFRPRVIDRLVREHVDQTVNRSSELWLLLVLELWQRQFLDGAREGVLH